MFRTALITLATLLAGGSIALSRQVPVRVNMKQPVQVLLGLGFFFMLFFVAVRFIDDYFWWSIPAIGFVCVFYYGFRRLDDINRLIVREKPNRWLTETAQLMPSTGAAMTAGQLEAALAAFDHYHEEHTEPQERRFLDAFFIADEADQVSNGPTEVELEHLDDFIFTARHGYLVHDGKLDAVLCDVTTISPGMSIADLIDIARSHECLKEGAKSL